MMITGHSHLGHEPHHDRFRHCDHSIYIDQVCSTNYIEPASLLATNNSTPTVNLSTGQEATPSTMSICLQPHGTFGTPIAAAQSSQHDRINHDLWPSRLTPSGCGGAGQWSNGHKFYTHQEQQNICEKQTQASNGTFYDYLQTKFTPIANYNDQLRPPDTVKLDSHQHQQYLITVNDYSQHYYNSNVNNQANPTTTNYNIDEYGNQIAHRNYQTDMTDHIRYTQPAYSDNHHHTSMFNQTEPTNLNEPSLLYQQNYTPLSKPTRADRFTQADQSHSWASHQDYTRAIMSHHQHHQPQPGVVGADFAQQTNSWLDKPETRAQYQTHEATYDYYRSPQPPPPLVHHCTPNQPYHANQTDPNRVQIIESSPSLAATNYEPAEPIASIGLQTSEQIDAVRSVLKPQSKIPLQGTPSSVQCKKSSVVQAAKKRHECKDEIKDPDQAATNATSTSNNQHTNQSDRLNQCRICGRHYARPSTLKTHLRTHTNERPYKCAVCCKTFSQAANLTAHQRVHTGERPFPCPICGRQFSQSSSVITHLRTHSGERPYRCNMCQRTFSDSSTLTKHCRIHSGEKPYQCEHCPMNFSQSGNLSRHLRLHSIGGLNKTQPTTETVAEKPSVPPSNTGAVGVESSTRSSVNQRNYSSNLSFSPESTLSSYSVSSLVLSGTGNSTPTSSVSS